MNDKEKHIVPIDLLTKVLAGEANADELDLIEKWQNNSEANRSEYEQFKKLWNYTTKVENKADIDVDQEWVRMEKVMSTDVKKHLGFSTFLRIAAAILILASAAVFTIRQAQTTSYNAKELALNDIQLPDGSVVSLNANSKLSFDKGFGTKHRDVKLVGEGFFEVAKNKDLPYIIQAADAQVKVVGTKFNVKAYKKQNEVKVTVTEGKVLLSDKKKSSARNIYLKAGETGRLNNTEGKIEKNETINMNDISWKTFELDFNNSTLAEVVDVLSNTYHIDIKVDDNIRNCEITVHFSNTDFVSVLKVLKSTLDLSVKKQNDIIYISGKQCAE